MSRALDPPAGRQVFTRTYTPTPAERDAIDVFLMAKCLRLVAGMAWSSTAVGRGTLRFRNLDWLGDYIRTRARSSGLL